MQEFDLCNSPLEGSNLIEAGAGTGKTSTISGIYSRLLLEKRLGVEDILVVTFTVAATEELKDRVRKRLFAALQYFNSSQAFDSEDLLLQNLESKLDPLQASTHLRTALQNFDQARIFTIHGFCQRLLTEHAFECCHPFEQEFITDQSGIIRELIGDFWRKRLQGESSIFASYSRQNGLSIQKLLDLSLAWLKHPRLQVIPSPCPVYTGRDEEAFSEVFNRAKDCWLNQREKILKLLCESNNIKKKNYPNWAVKIDSYFEYPGVEYPQELPRFSTVHLIPGDGVKKNSSPPKHEFFELATELVQTADALRELFDRKINSLKSELLDELSRKLPERKERLGVLSFEDLLQRTQKTLTSSAGDMLLKTAGQRYKAGLIDEFQDTDPVQYQIFNTLFGDGRPLFFIGDPKQSIYGFRGADIYAYLETKRNVHRQYTLKTNWRSEEGLLGAINAFFARNRPFILEEIQYQDLQATEAQQERIILKKESAAGLVIWNTDSCPDKVPEKPLPKGTAEEYLAQATASEISRILQLSRQGLACFQNREGSSKISPEHFAVLVRTHKQAYLVHRELHKAGIPGVMAKSGNLFHSQEAREVEHILCALENPGDTPNLCTALCTSILGFSAREIYELTQNQERFLHWVSKMHSYQTIWQENGIMAALSKLLREQGAVQRALEKEGGQRRITNILHLVEVLHKQEKEQHLCSRELLLWLDRNMDSGQENNEEHELRLETDERAVTLITIHRSKGLQFPIVFAPFVFSGFDAQLPALFHDPAAGFELGMDLGSDFAKGHLELYQWEQLAENLRLFYVALSRAKHLCYTAWGHVNSSRASAPMYLLHAKNNKPGQELAECREISENLTTEQVEKALEQLSKETQGIAVRKLPVQDPLPWQETPGEELPGENLQIQRNLQSNRQLSSFTHMLHGVGEDSRNLVFEKGQDDVDLWTDNLSEMAEFPKGAKAGDFLHALLEQADYQQLEPEAHSALVRQTLQSYRLDLDWEATLCRFLSRILQAPLDEQKGIVLQQVPANHRVHELEFYLPLAQVSPGELQKFYRKQDDCELNPLFAKELDRLQFSPHQGFLRGFIDLIFYSTGKYYLVDWKSNYLGPDPRDYAPERLENVMLREFYLLQSHLYTLALHEHLEHRLPNYDYTEHFGGILYVFLRGVDKNSPGQGIFYQKPSREFMNKLQELLLAL